MFLGHHTVAETKGIMQSIDHRFTVDDKAFQDALTANPNAVTPLKANWDALKTKWSKAKADATASMLVKSATAGGITFGLASTDDKVPAEDDYQAILGFTEGDTGDPQIHPNDSIRGIELQLQKALGHTIDIDTGNPALDPNNPIQKAAMLDPDTGLLQNQTIATMSDAGKVILQNLGIPTDDQCTPAAQAAIRAGMKSQGMPDSAIDAYFAVKCKKDTSLRTIAIVAGVAVLLFFGVQFLAPVVVAVGSVRKH